MDEIAVASLYFAMGDDRSKALIGCDSLIAFYNYFAKCPHSMLTEEAKVLAASWFQPFFDGAFFGLWFHHSIRGSHKALSFVNSSLEEGLAIWPHIFCMTKQAQVHKLAVRMGFQLLGEYDRLWDGGPAWLSSLSLDSYNEAKSARMWRCSNGWRNQPKQPNR